MITVRDHNGNRMILNKGYCWYDDGIGIDDDDDDDDDDDWYW